jgi:hypothetical protein
VTSTRNPRVDQIDRVPCLAQWASMTRSFTLAQAAAAAAPTPCTELVARHTLTGDSQPRNGVPTVAEYLRDHFGLVVTGSASGYAVTEQAVGAVGKALQQLKRDMHAQLIAAMAEFAINARLPDGLSRNVWMDDVSKLAAYIPTSGWDARLTQYNLGGRNPGLDIPITSGAGAVS